MPHDKKTALVYAVDDSADDRFVLARAFKASAAEVELRLFGGGAEMLATLQGSPGGFAAPGTLPRLILLDLVMPGMNGLEVARALKQDARLRRIPVVVLTGSDSPENIAAAYDCGVNSLTAKPATYAETVRLVERLVHYWLHLVEAPAT